MTEPSPVEFIEDRVPVDGIETAIMELVELYGGEITNSGLKELRFVLPLRRGLATSGAVECTLSWTSDDQREATVKLVCDRDLDPPKLQRVLMLAAGVVGSLLFMMWPFFPQSSEMGTVAWMGGAVAIAVYIMALRKTSGGLAFDFLRRLAKRQREAALDAA